MDTEVIEKVASHLVVPFASILTTHPTNAISRELVGGDSKSRERSATLHALIKSLANELAAKLGGCEHKRDESSFKMCACALEQPLTMCLQSVADQRMSPSQNGDTPRADAPSSSPCDDGNQWKEFCSRFQDSELNGLPLAEIPPCCWNDPLLQQYLQPSAHNASQCKKPTTSATADIAKKDAKRALCERLLIDGVTPKKRYEVVRAACYIHHKTQSIVKESKSSHARVVLVDVGAGQGYLSAFLAVCFGYDVVALERDDNQVHGSTKRSVALSLVQSVADAPREECDASGGHAPHLTELEKEHPQYGHASSRMGKVAVCHASVDSGTQWMEIESRVVQALADETSKNGRNASILAEATHRDVAEEQERFIFVMYSLHACGPLSSNMIRLFSQWRSCALLVNVGCCYNMLADERADVRVSTCAGGGGPMSAVGKRLLLGDGSAPSLEHQERSDADSPDSVRTSRVDLWGKAAFMAACQAPHRWLENAATPATNSDRTSVAAKRKRMRNALRQSGDCQQTEREAEEEGDVVKAKETVQSDLKVGLCELAEAIHANFDRAIFQSFLDESTSFSFSPQRHGKLWTKARLAVQRASKEELARVTLPLEDSAVKEVDSCDSVLQTRFAHALVRTLAAYCELEGEEPPSGADAALMFRRAWSTYNTTLANDTHLKFAAYWVCRALVGHAMERFILEDRLCFLKEIQRNCSGDANQTIGIHGAQLVRLFDVSASPRCVAVVAWR